MSQASYAERTERLLEWEWDHARKMAIQYARLSGKQRCLCLLFLACSASALVLWVVVAHGRWELATLAVVVVSFVLAAYFGKQVDRSDALAERFAARMRMTGDELLDDLVEWKP